MSFFMARLLQEARKGQQLEVPQGSASTAEVVVTTEADPNATRVAITSMSFFMERLPCTLCFGNH